MQSKINLQEVLLNQTRKDKTQVTIFLANGFQLKGYIKGFDSFTVVIESEGRQQMIYKHAISTIIPARPVDFQNAGDFGEEDKP
ncbi:MAG: RNA chaperone Hfq [Clostridiales bacterium]|nr:RNA chaperone Hfq [Clostridiales bacterium]